MADITMPRLSDTMEEGTIARWLKQPGDRVEQGEVVAEIETDKAVMELEAYDGGVLEKILVAEGETVPIGQPIALVGSGEGAQAPAAGNGAPASSAPVVGQPATPGQPTSGGEEKQAEAAPAQAATSGDITPSPGTQTGAPEYGGPAHRPDPEPVADGAPAPSGGKVRASPLAKAIAREHGLDLATITGTGPNGRVVREDVLAVVEGRTKPQAAPATPATPASAPAPAQVSTGASMIAGNAPAAPAITPAPTTGVTAGEGDEEIPLTNMRKVVARRLTESMQQAPHFYLTVKVQVDELLALRKQLNDKLAAQGVKVSVNDLLIKAAATAIDQNRGVNVSFAGDRIIKRARINIGVAVAVQGGLIVPVVKDANTKSVSQVAKDAKALIAKARDNKLKPEEFSGGTFTISNLGMFGISQFTAVINSPESAILAVGQTEPEVYLDGDQVKQRQVMRLTLSIDHRSLDGATAAEFLQQLVAILEEPLRIIA